MTVEDTKWVGPAVWSVCVANLYLRGADEADVAGRTCSTVKE